MNIHIAQIKNQPVDSNCYVISKEGSQGCIIIDPGAKDGDELFRYLTLNNLYPEFIVLTHEHFDHIWGVDKLKEAYNPKLVCSRYCSGKIIKSKGNLSVFYDQEGFATVPADLVVEEIDYSLTWNNLIVKFISTPGHTGGCISVDIDNSLFTGDFIIKGVKTNTKLPGSSATKFQQSIEQVVSAYRGKNTRVYPGHGDPFDFQEILPALTGTPTGICEPG
ncbi:MAG: MBL fold metallo-hydrolase [Bacteroidales bacterium]